MTQITEEQRESLARAFPEGIYTFPSIAGICTSIESPYRITEEILHFIAEREEKAEEEALCPKCNGRGYEAGHDTPNRHGEDGECLTCPIQIPCELCEGDKQIDYDATF